MKKFQNLIVLFGLLLVSINGLTYTTIMKDLSYQLRRYDSCIVAQTVVDASHQDASSQAFGILGGYIFGRNSQRVKIDMTSPVTSFRVQPGRYAVQFFMPSEWTLETLPQPLDRSITIKVIPQRTLFVVRYRGGWSERVFEQQANDLYQEALNRGYQIVDGAQPIWAKYDSPMVPVPYRTNQVMYEVYE